MRVLEGYREYLKRKDDLNLKESIEKEGAFFIFESIEAWKNESNPAEIRSLPAAELIKDEYKKNRFIAPP